MKTTIEILTEARALISKPGAWTQGVYARNANGEHVPVLSRRSVCFCAEGAIRSAISDYEHRCEATQALGRAIGVGGVGHVAEWNDAPERTQAEVIDAFDRAIAMLAPPVLVTQ